MIDKPASQLIIVCTGETYNEGGEARARSGREKVLGDLAVEPGERFAVRISDPTRASISDGRARGVILNDD